MSNWQLGLWIIVIFQRFIELILAQRNAKWIRTQGGYEVGREHYPLFLLIHILFFLGIWLEADQAPSWWSIPFLIFAATQLLRLWSIQSLGRFWNTRIWIIPNQLAPVRGPYRYLRHPNYLVVMIEFIVFPLIYQAYYTAIILSVLNAYLLLAIRIPMEERALQEATRYQEVMEEKNRFFPTWRLR